MIMANRCRKVTICNNQRSFFAIRAMPWYGFEDGRYSHLIPIVVTVVLVIIGFWSWPTPKASPFQSTCWTRSWCTVKVEQQHRHATRYLEKAPVWKECLWWILSPMSYINTVAIDRPDVDLLLYLIRNKTGKIWFCFPEQVGLTFMAHTFMVASADLIDRLSIFS